MNTLTTPATFNGVYVIPAVKPDFEPDEVIVTFKPKARDMAGAKPMEEWRKKALALQGTLDVSTHPEFADPAAYVRKLRNLELKEMEDMDKLWGRTGNDAV